MTLNQIKAGLLSVPLKNLNAAFKNTGGHGGSVSKAEMIEHLANKITVGFITLDWVRLQGITGTVGAPVPAFPVQAAPANQDAGILRKSIDAVADTLKQTEADIRAAFGRDILSISQGVDTLKEELKLNRENSLRNIQTVKADWVSLFEQHERKMDSAIAAVQGAAKVDPATVAAEVRAGLDAALAPFRAAIEVPEVREQIEEVLAQQTIIDRRPASVVFGITVNDIRGQELMFDIWNDAEAPAVDPVFIWTPEIIRNLYLAQQGARQWFGGEKGTGKTQTALQFAARTGRSFTRINFHGYSCQEDYIGATGIENGTSGFQPGPFLRAFTRPGAVVLLDEPSNAKPAHLAPLNALLEPGGAPTIGGSVWRGASGVCVFAADNSLGGGDTTGRYPGLNQANSALVDRFSYLVQFEYLPESEEIKAVMNHTGCSQSVAEHVVKALNVARARVSTGDIIDPPSIRSIIGFIRAIPVMGVPAAWQQAIAARQPQESALGLAAVYTATINAQFLIDNI